MSWFKKQNTIPPDIACMLSQELSSGGARYISATIDENRRIRLTRVGTSQDAEGMESVGVHARHVLDKYYRYGITFSPEGNIADIYYDLNKDSTGMTHSIISKEFLDNHYFNWTGVESDAVSRIQKIYPTAVIDSGYTGLARVFNLDREPFIYCSIERFDSTIAYIQGKHVYGHIVIPIGVSSMTRAVADSLSCPTEMASNVVRTYGVQSTHYDRGLQQRIVESVQPLLVALAEFMENLQVSAYRPTILPSQPNCFVFGGIGSDIPGLNSLIQEVLNLDSIDNVAPEIRDLVLELHNGPSKSQLPRYYPLLGLLMNQVANLSK